MQLFNAERQLKAQVDIEMTEVLVTWIEHKRGLEWRSLLAQVCARDDFECEINFMLMQLLIMLDALKSESPHQITVAPKLNLKPFEAILIDSLMFLLRSPFKRSFSKAFLKAFKALKLRLLGAALRGVRAAGPEVRGRRCHRTQAALASHGHGGRGPLRDHRPAQPGGGGLQPSAGGPWTSSPASPLAICSQIYEYNIS